MLPTPETKVPSNDIESVADDSAASNKAAPIILCSAALIVSFFLPWITFLGVSRSLFTITQRGGANVLYWAGPIFAAIAAIAVITRRNPKTAAQLAGAAPFFIVGHGLFQLGADFLQLLSFGAYVSLIVGVALFILPRHLK